MRQAAWSMAFLMLGVVLLAGCVERSDEEVVYTHQWFWGASAYGTDTLPVFRDSFEVEEDVEGLEVRVDWGIDSGRAAIVLTPPGMQREPVNHTDEDTNGPRGKGVFQVTPEPGLWGFEIPTWYAEDGVFPAGEVRVDVVSFGEPTQ